MKVEIFSYETTHPRLVEKLLNDDLEMFFQRQSKQIEIKFIEQNIYRGYHKRNNTFISVWYEEKNYD